MTMIKPNIQVYLNLEPNSSNLDNKLFNSETNKQFIIFTEKENIELVCDLNKVKWIDNKITDLLNLDIYQNENLIIVFYLYSLPTYLTLLKKVKEGLIDVNKLNIEFFVYSELDKKGEPLIYNPRWTQELKPINNDADYNPYSNLYTDLYLSLI